MPIRSLIPACVLLLALPLSAASAQTPAKDTSPRVILVSGVGEVSGKPDRAQLSAGVLTQGPTAAAALAANNTAMNGVFAALKKIGIPDNKIQTSNFSVSPQYAPYRQDNPQPAKIVGYQVSNNVTVIVDDLSKTGPTLDALVQSGANQLGGVSFSIANPKPLAEQARRDAVADAAAKAKTLAAAAGVTLGQVMEISEGAVSRPVPMMAMRAMAADAAPTPIAAGEENVSVSVTMTYAIQ